MKLNILTIKRCHKTHGRAARLNVLSINILKKHVILIDVCITVFHLQGVQLKSGPYFNMSNLFTKIYNILYYTTNLYLQ